jgi:hypothetical protein
MKHVTEARLGGVEQRGKGLQYGRNEVSGVMSGISWRMIIFSRCRKSVRELKGPIISVNESQHGRMEP